MDVRVLPIVLLTMLAAGCGGGGGAPAVPAPDLENAEEPVIATIDAARRRVMGDAGSAGAWGATRLR